MARFPCNGYVYVTPQDGFIEVTLKHLLDHQKYKDIEIPSKWHQFIQDNHKCGPTKVCTSQFIGPLTTELAVKIWRDILQQTGGGKGIAFRQKAVRYCWIQETSQLWRCADDPIESAYEWCRQFGVQEDIKIIEMEPVLGAHAFAFIVKDFMDAWVHHTDSFLVDSTCESP